MKRVNFDGAEALTASETVPLDKDLPGSFTRTWCKDTLTAIRKITQWIN